MIRKDKIHDRTQNIKKRWYNYYSETLLYNAYYNTIIKNSKTQQILNLPVTCYLSSLQTFGYGQYR